MCTEEAVFESKEIYFISRINENFDLHLFSFYERPIHLNKILNKHNILYTKYIYTAFYVNLLLFIKRKILFQLLVNYVCPSLPPGENTVYNYQVGQNKVDVNISTF